MGSKVGGFAGSRKHCINILFTVISKLLHTVSTLHTHKTLL